MKENVPFRLHNLLKEYKVFVHNLWKSVCVRVECSTAEECQDTLEWEANRSAGYCLPCLELLQPMTLNQALWKLNPLPIETITKPSFRWNRNLCRSVFLNISRGWIHFKMKSNVSWNSKRLHHMSLRPVPTILYFWYCDDNYDDPKYLHLWLIETTVKSINALEQETFCSIQPVSTSDVDTLFSAVFL